MIKTNFVEWAKHYNVLLSRKYYEFCYLFPEDEEPMYGDFVRFVWSNTTKTYNHVTCKYEAKLN